MYRTTKRKMVRQFSVSAIVAVGAIATGAGVANASTHAATKVHAPSSARTSRASDESARSGERRGASGGGDITALTATSLTVLERDGTSRTYTLNGSTTVTNHRAASTAASLALGENVHLRLSSTDATVATGVDIVPANIAGKVTAVVGDTITIVGPGGTVGTIVANATTSYSKAGASVTRSDVTVGSFVFAEGTFASSSTSVDATSVGIGQMGPHDRADGGGPMNRPDGPGGPVPSVPPGDGGDHTY